MRTKFNPETPFVISCGKNKLKTKNRVQAWRLYQGSYYKTMLRLATTVSTNIFILSAKFGLVKANDMLPNYDLKMSAKMAREYKEQKLLYLERYWHVLPKTYMNAMCGKGKHVFGRPLPMGYSLQKAGLFIQNRKPLIDLRELEDGDFVEPVY